MPVRQNICKASLSAKESKVERLKANRYEYRSLFPGFTYSIEEKDSKERIFLVPTLTKKRNYLTLTGLNELKCFNPRSLRLFRANAGAD